MWQKGRKKLIRLGVRAREENSIEGMKLNVEKAGGWRSEELWEASLQVGMLFWGCFSQPHIISIQALPFLLLKLVYMLPSPISTCHCPLCIQFSASRLLQKQFERVLLFLFLILLSLKILIKIIENQIGNKYFLLLSLPPSLYIPLLFHIFCE